MVFVISNQNAYITCILSVTADWLLSCIFFKAWFAVMFNHCCSCNSSSWWRLLMRGGRKCFIRRLMYVVPSGGAWRVVVNWSWTLVFARSCSSIFSDTKWFKRCRCEYNMMWFLWCQMLHSNVFFSVCRRIVFTQRWKRKVRCVALIVWNSFSVTEILNWSENSQWCCSSMSYDHVNIYIYEFYNLYPARENRKSSPGVYSLAGRW